MTSFSMGLYRVAEWIMRLAYVNFLWLGFTICGLILFGFMPATVAMFAVVRRWVRGEDDIKVFPVFWSTYRDEFVKSNLLGYVLALIGYVLSIELKILRASDQLMYLIASFGVVALFILYFIVLLYFFPIYVHFDLPKLNYFKWPFIIGIIHPILTIALFVVLYFIYYFALQTVPALLFFFGGSVMAFIIMWGAHQTFSKFEAEKA